MGVQPQLNLPHVQEQMTKPRRGSPIDNHILRWNRHHEQPVGTHVSRWHRHHESPVGKHVLRWHRHHEQPVGTHVSRWHRHHESPVGKHVLRWHRHHEPRVGKHVLRRYRHHEQPVRVETLPEEAQQLKEKILRTHKTKPTRFSLSHMKTVVVPPVEIPKEMNNDRALAMTVAGRSVPLTRCMWDNTKRRMHHMEQISESYPLDCTLF